MTARVRVVIPTLNGLHLLRPCLEALSKVDYPREAVDIVVVDNGSSDGTAQWLRDWRPDVQVLAPDRNLGYAGGNNLALRDLDGVDFVALLNNDTLVEPGWLAPLVAALEADPKTGAANSKIVFAPRYAELTISTPAFSPGRADDRVLGVRVSGLRVAGRDCLGDAQLDDGFYGPERGHGVEATFRWTRAEATLLVPVDSDAPPETCQLQVAAEREKTITVGGVSRVVSERPAWIEAPLSGQVFDVVNNAGSRLVRGGYGGDRGFREPDRGQFSQSEEVFAWCGCSVLLSTRYLRDAGLFDDRFFLYYEDFDLSWRGRARGWRYVYVPSSVVRHRHASTSIEGSATFQRYSDRNRLLTVTKNAPAGLAARAVFEYVHDTLVYARRDMIAPMLSRHRPDTQLFKGRLRALRGYVRELPRALVRRRRLRRGQQVPDAEMLAWAQEQ